MVEWVEKASFDLLNKLYVISSLEQDHQTLLLAQNLLAVVQEPQSYVLPIIPKRLPKIVIPREHHVLKDLPFYEETRKADAKAGQQRLDQREEKRQEGTLRKALGEKGQPSSSTARLPAKKKKKPTARVVEVLALAPASPSTFTLIPSVPLYLEDFAPDFAGDLDPPEWSSNP